MKAYKVFQKITIYEIVGEVYADSEEEALENIKKTHHYRFGVADIRDKYGGQQDETGKLAEIGEMVARKNPWHNEELENKEE